MISGHKCPNCGNTNPDTIMDNGCDPRDEDYTLLCVTRVPEEVTSYEIALLEPKDFDAEGRPECGWQWEPNSGAGIPD